MGYEWSHLWTDLPKALQGLGLGPSALMGSELYSTVPWAACRFATALAYKRWPDPWRQPLGIGSLMHQSGLGAGLQPCH